MNARHTENRVKIAPSVLAGDLSNLAQEVRAIERAGANMVHLDVMDGRFVPNFTFGQAVIKAVRDKTKLPFDAHLMIESPDTEVESFVSAGCDWISVHVEACDDVLATLTQIKSLGAKAGLAIKPQTPLSALTPAIGLADYFLVMSVEPGFSGQKFLPGSLERIAEVKAMTSHTGASIEVDGGITHSNAAVIVASGADILVAGKAVFGSNNYEDAIESLRSK